MLKTVKGTWKMTSSTIPEMHNLLHCRQTMIRPHHLQKILWSLDLCFDIRKQTHGHWSQYFTTLLVAK